MRMGNVYSDLHLLGHGLLKCGGAFSCSRRWFTRDGAGTASFVRARVAPFKGPYRWTCIDLALAARPSLAFPDLAELSYFVCAEFCKWFANGCLVIEAEQLHGAKSVRGY